MTSSSKPSVQNIKIGFKLVSIQTKAAMKKSARERCSKFTDYHNFSVIRDKHVFSIFWDSGYINATKIKSFREIEQAVSNISNILNVSRNQFSEKPTIHNICASGRLLINLNLTKLKNNLLQFEDIKITRNLASFPALFIKIPQLGTCVLFQNGKYSLVGIKSEDKIVQLYERIKDLVSV